MSYQVVSELVLAVDEDGHTHHYYRGATIEWLSDEQAAHFLSEGLVVDVGVHPGADPESQDGRTPPLRTAAKPVLVDWLAATGAYERDDLETQTKDDLWALIDAE